MPKDSNSSQRAMSPSMWDIAELRLGRRGALKGILAAAAAMAAPSWFAFNRAQARSVLSQGTSSLTFQEIAARIDRDHHVAPGYTARILLRWGDPLWSDGPQFDAASMTAAGQHRQLGYNNDFLAFMPLPMGSQNSDHGLLCINHEYTNPHLMWPATPETARLALSKAQCEYEKPAHGHSVVEIRRIGGVWATISDSRYNRRFTAVGPAMRLSGPAAGHLRLRTKSDPTGTLVQGTLNNCAGGVTPWGTVLIAEENFNKYFGGSA